MESDLTVYTRRNVSKSRSVHAHRSAPARPIFCSFSAQLTCSRPIYREFPFEFGFVKFQKSQELRVLVRP